MSTLRIRDNATVRELKIPKEVLEVLEKVVYSPKFADEVKKIMIKKLTHVSPCCVCGTIPVYEVSYPFHEGGATRIERYCKRCIERVFSKEQDNIL